MLVLVRRAFSIVNTGKKSLGTFDVSRLERMSTKIVDKVLDSKKRYLAKSIVDNTFSIESIVEYLWFAHSILISKAINVPK